MNKIKQFSFLIWPLVVLLIAFGAFIFKPWHVAPKETVSVTATGTSKAAPTVAKISGNIQTTAQSAEAAQSQNQQKSGNLIEAVKQTGIEEKNIQTTNISVNPQYDYQKRPSQIINYQANTTITVTIKDLENADKVLNTLTQNNVTSIYGPNLEVDDQKLEEAKQEARGKAVSAAKEKAAQLVSLSGRRLGKVVSIEESDGGFSIPQPIPLGVGGADLEKQTSQIEPGQRDVTITLKVDFEIK